MGKVVEEAFELTQEDTNVTQADTTVGEWGDLFLYEVPVGTSHVLKREHTISAYLKDTNNVVLTDNQLVKIEVRDQAQQDRKTVYGPAIYKTIQDFSDQRKMARLNLSEPIYLKEGMYIAFMVKNSDSYGADKDYSYMNLIINRVRQTL